MISNFHLDVTAEGSESLTATLLIAEKQQGNCSPKFYGIRYPGGNGPDPVLG